jgi:cob(I)alamin adenosyltransferase
MKIYTKTGDGGETGLFAGPRVWKDDPRIEAYGTVDELNSLLGLACSDGHSEAIEATLATVQHELFAVGAELATPDPIRQGTNLIDDSHVRQLEQAIDRHEEDLPPLRQFILPGGSRRAACLHVARAVCRRAERHVVTLWRQSQVSNLGHIIRYLNRLSDLLFVLSRAANQATHEAEIEWQKPQRDPAPPDSPSA